MKRFEGMDQSGFNAARDEARAANADRVRFNVETKVNPRRGYAERTVRAHVMARRVGAAIVGHGLEARATVQSFDLHALIGPERGPRFANMRAATTGGIVAPIQIIATRT